MLFCLKFLQINGRILRRNLHFIEKNAMLRRCAFPAWHFLWFWICSLIRSWLVCVVSILIPCIPGLILICFHIQKSGILSASQIFSKKKKVPKNQHFFTHHPYFLDINTTHSTCPVPGNKSTGCTFCTTYPISCNTAQSLAAVAG